jgi:4-amino-4-deoxy-L-arabinose transferase-like glycosyltransferase
VPAQAAQDATLGTTTPGDKRWRRRVGILAPLVLAAAVLWQATLFRNSTSAVWDETIYLSVGLTLYHHGDFGRLADSAIAPLPVLVSYWLPALAVHGDQVAPSEFAGAIRLARLAHVVLVGLPLVLLPYAWMARRRGVLAACIVGAMLAFSPNVMALSSVATTDACFSICVLVALTALDRYLRGPSTRWFVLAGAATGIALAAKYSALFLLPVALVALAALRLRGAPGPAAWMRASAAAIGQAILFGVVALLVAWSLHGFAVATVFPADWTPPASVRGAVADAAASVGRTVPLPTPVKGIVGQVMHMRGGQPAFLMGQRSARGWWYYFPVALLLKSTPGELLLVVMLPFLLWLARRDLDAAPKLVLLSIVLCGGSLLTSRLDIGIRYALVLYPLLALVVVDCAAVVAQRRARLLPAIAIVLVTAQVVSAVGAAPGYLSYFNSLFTRSGEGYTRLVDSNLDWGQDLPALREALERRNATTALLAYFGSAPPEAYAIQAVPWDWPDQSTVARCRWIAISATLLNGVYLRGDPFQDFRRLAPDARPSDSIFLYDGAREDVRHALAVARSYVPAQPCRPGATVTTPADSMSGVMSHWHIRCNGV